MSWPPPAPLTFCALSLSPLSPLSLSSPISPPLLGFLSHLRSFNDFPFQHFKMQRLRVLGCVIAVASYCCLILLVTAQPTDPSEVKALLAVKSRLIDPHNYLGNWNKGDPCISNWTKVVCSNETGSDGYLHITELLLLNMNLSGNLAPELGQLSHLRIIDFMWNGLTGTIPKEIGKISSLTLLLLNGNKLSGSLPEELGYLSNLDRLQVDENQMSGPIPKSFANLVRVKHLHMNNNSFSGQIPSELSQLPIIIHLLLDSNNLSGHLPPELSNLTEMRILQLDNNNFGFEIPASFGNLSRLVKLSLRNCSLQGVVPDLSKIANLTYLDLSRNHLIGPIPSQKLSDNMTTIDLSYNNLNGSIPRTFLDLPRLQKIDLRNNSLSDISGDLDPPANVSLRLENNPICTNATGQNIGQFCRLSADKNEIPENSRDPNETSCQIPSCPLDNFYEFVPNSTVYCFCAAPIRIGYRLKSPSFSYFRPYYNDFKVYLTSSLNLDVSQLIIDSFSWEEGPRLRMYLKLFPMFGASHSNSFNSSEVQRIKRKFTSWEFPRTDFFGPYELLNFTLLGPYSDVIFTNEGSSGINKGILAAIVLGAIACFFTISAVVFLLITRHRYLQAPSRRRSSLMISIKIDGVKTFTFKELATATQNFDSSTLVGRGGYGKVYKGILADETIVAIKRAEEGSLQGQKEFLTEIELLSRLHHRNLVSLIGYCDEEEEQMLVYEFMPNGTLRDWLSAKAKGILNFSTRLRIALGSAKGILYLHTEAEPPIFHRDIKATNILLDSNLTAKVADFGLSRLAPNLDAEGNVPGYVSTVVKGTPGYLDPEYFLTRKLTDKSDVYSLGVVFLELLTCMHPISHGKNIVREVMAAHQSGIMFSVIDSRMGSYPSECVERFATLALSCCDDKTEKRPPMLAVVRELENILKMMPESDNIVSESTSTFSVSSTTQSSSFMTSSSLVSSSLIGSDLVSGVIPTITPR